MWLSIPCKQTANPQKHGFRIMCMYRSCYCQRRTCKLNSIYIFCDFDCFGTKDRQEIYINWLQNNICQILITKAVENRHKMLEIFWFLSHILTLRIQKCVEEPMVKFTTNRQFTISKKKHISLKIIPIYCLLLGPTLDHYWVKFSHLLFFFKINQHRKHGKWSELIIWNICKMETRSNSVWG